MTEQQLNNQFKTVESVITDPLKFKAKLAIGEDAYTSLRIKNWAMELWDAAGAATTAAAIASSTVVASTFFAPKGFWSFFGFGKASTPIGWIIAAGVITGLAWIAVSRFLRGKTGNKVSVIPHLLNTPINVLAVDLFNFIAPLAFKIAAADGEIVESERAFIQQYFVHDWGYSAEFTQLGLQQFEQNLGQQSIKELAECLATFKKTNRDCNYREMSKEILQMLEGLMLADDSRDQREVDAIADVALAFRNAASINPLRRSSKR